jgi:hypothetical protein
MRSFPVGKGGVEGAATTSPARRAGSAVSAEGDGALDFATLVSGVSSGGEFVALRARRARGWVRLRNLVLCRALRGAMRRQNSGNRLKQPPSLTNPILWPIKTRIDNANSRVANAARGQPAEAALDAPRSIASREKRHRSDGSRVASFAWQPRGRST